MRSERGPLPDAPSKQTFLFFFFFFSFFSFIDIGLTYSPLSVSGVQHNDLTSIDCEVIIR